MIDIQNISFGYRTQNELFQDLSLQLGAGHIHGLLGKNGAGKTTLLKLISGALFPYHGFISTFGYTPSKRNPLMLQDIYFLPEEIYLPDLTIQGFVKVYAPFYPRFDYQEFDSLSQEFEIPLKTQKLHTLSHGQKKKIQIAFSLATNTRLLIMDEPTNGLDIPAKSQFRRIVANSFQEDRCVIISTHQVRDLHSLIDHITVLDEHNIIMSHGVDEITKRLLFKWLDVTETPKNALYSEESLKGIAAVFENTQQIDSKLDIEIMFNALFANKEKFKELFSK
ncbi:MAG: ABC transporter ATP-binding protein [Prevotellaceae bacterium]|nr:ABC transporter ATP-binding protein [Prevotellaceae bacterium]